MSHKNITFPISLKFFISLLLLGFIQSAILYYISVDNLVKSLLHDNLQTTKSQLFQFQENIEYFYRHKDLIQIQNQTANMNINEHLESIFVFSPEQQVIASNKRMFLGLDIHSPTIKKHLPKNISDKTHLINNHQRLNPNSENTIEYLAKYNKKRAGNSGLIYLKFNISNEIALGKNQLNKSFMNTIIVLTIVFIVTGLLFHYLVTRRINTLNSATKNLINSNFKYRLNENGNDEISLTFKNFNIMSNEISIKHNKIIDQKNRLLRSQELAHLGTWDYNVAKDELTWSDETYRIFELEDKGKPLKYETFLNFIHPQDITKVNSVYLDSVKNSAPGYEVVHRIITNNKKETKYVLEKCTHIRNNKGDITHSQGMVLDITNRIKNEQELQNNADKFIKWKNSNFIGIVTSREDGSVIDCNETLLKMIGYNQADIKNSPINLTKITPTKFKDLDKNAIIQAN